MYSHKSRRSVGERIKEERRSNEVSPAATPERLPVLVHSKMHAVVHVVRRPRLLPALRVPPGGQHRVHPRRSQPPCREFETPSEPGTTPRSATNYTPRAWCCANSLAERKKDVMTGAPSRDVCSCDQLTPRSHEQGIPPPRSII